MVREVPEGTMRIAVSRHKVFISMFPEPGHGFVRYWF